MFQYPFMQNAFLAGTIVAVMCGVIAVFVIARGLSFIAHTFSHIGFSGAAFAVFMGWSPLNGLLLFTSASALIIGRMGVKTFRRDVSISIVLSVFLGLGYLFLKLSNTQSTGMMSLLFGSVIGISVSDIWLMTWLSASVLVLLVLGYKMLVFDSFDPVGAEAARLPIRFISIGFLLLISVAIAESVQFVGALLVFTLMTTPAATARYLTQSVFRMMVYSAVIAVIGLWAGLVLGYYTSAPTSFYISAVEGVLYFMALGWHSLRERMAPKLQLPSAE
ncbi:MAG: Zinc/manganese transport system permease protein [Bacilli bacterium]|nr:Zinc/manganese transport system permease protein [Bacilli bacterium]